MRQLLPESGSSSPRTRTWCRTGSALRTRTSGTVTVSDADTPEKKGKRGGARARGGRRDGAAQ
jgi:hypothetical protein